MAKLTLEERRIQTLRQQLLGKHRLVIPTQKTKDDPKTTTKSNTFNLSESLDKPSTGTGTTTSATYLKNDLFKILLLSSIAIGAQILLLYAANNNLINLSNLHI